MLMFDAGMFPGQQTTGSKTMITYTALNDPLAANDTVAQGVNNASRIVGWYQASSDAYYGFLYSGGSYTTLNDPLAVGSAEPLTMALGADDADDIVGLYRGADNHIHGFLYSSGTYTTIDDPLGVKTEAYAINKRGQIVGITTTATAASTGSSTVAASTSP
jgi:uncharacterized membrane protein